MLDTDGVVWTRLWTLVDIDVVQQESTRLGGEVLRKPRRLASMSMWKSVCLNELLNRSDKETQLQHLKTLDHVK